MSKRNRLAASISDWKLEPVPGRPNTFRRVLPGETGVAEQSLKSLASDTCPKPKAAGQTPAGQMNKTEREYAGILDFRKAKGEIVSWEYEAMHLRIGETGRRCWYHIDFMVLMPDGKVEFHEVKGGFARDDARVKFEAAKRIYGAWGKWVWAQKKGKEWIYH